MAVDIEPDDLLGLPLRVLGIVGELDAPCLAAPARQDLRLDDDLASQLLGCGAGLGRRLGESALRRRDPEAPEELLALVFVEVHRRRTLAVCGHPKRRSNAVDCPVGRAKATPSGLVPMLPPPVRAGLYCPPARAGLYRRGS